MGVCIIKILTAFNGVIFPGQGSQSVGMLLDIAAQYAEVQHTFDEASAVLGYDLWRIVTEGPSTTLDQTVYTQPALLASAYAVWRILEARGLFASVKVLAGHSLGEYSALLAGGALSFQEALSDK